MIKEDVEMKKIMRILLCLIIIFNLFSVVDASTVVDTSTEDADYRVIHISSWEDFYNAFRASVWWDDNFNRFL